MSALLFGSISAIADTSELQRQAFNDAFAEHGLDWSWDQQRYRELLTGNGGAQRIADVADERGDDVDAEAVHATKSRLFQERLRESGADARPGVHESIAAARDVGAQVAVVTTTSPANVAAVLSAVGLDADDLDLVLTGEDVGEGKPAPRVYEVALERLDVGASDCVAVEDNVGGVRAATGAGIACIATPNTNTAGHDFDHATVVADTLDPAQVTAHLGGGATAA